MKKVYKYPLRFDPVSIATVDLPLGAKLLDVDDQRGTLCLWALVDLGAVGDERRRIVILGTGSEAPENLGAHISTFKVAGGSLVFHAFELEG